MITNDIVLTFYFWGGKQTNVCYPCVIQSLVLFSTVCAYTGKSVYSWLPFCSTLYNQRTLVLFTCYTVKCNTCQRSWSWQEAMDIHTYPFTHTQTCRKQTHLYIHIHTFGWAWCTVWQNWMAVWPRRFSTLVDITNSKHQSQVLVQLGSKMCLLLSCALTFFHVR